MKGGSPLALHPDPDIRNVDAVFHLLGGILGIIIGLLLVAFGEIIGVLFAIEANTRASVAEHNKRADPVGRKDVSSFCPQ